VPLPLPCNLSQVFLFGFGGLWVACWPLVPKFAGSNPAEAFGFLGRKNPQHAFLRPQCLSARTRAHFTLPYAGISTCLHVKCQILPEVYLAGVILNVPMLHFVVIRLAMLRDRLQTDGRIEGFYFLSVAQAPRTCLE